VIVPTVVFPVELQQAEPPGEDEQSQNGYRHPGPPTAKELVVLHRLSVLKTSPARVVPAHGQAPSSCK